MSEALSTIQEPYRLLRGTADTPISTADTDLTASTKTWATFVSTYHPNLLGDKARQVPATFNEVTIVFDFKNADTDTCAMSLYAYKEGSPAEFVCSINTITAGNQESGMIEKRGGATTRYFGDTIATITQRWPNTVAESDSAGNNGMAKLTFDARGYKYLLCLFTTISSNDSVRAWFTGH